MVNPALRILWLRWHRKGVLASLIFSCKKQFHCIKKILLVPPQSESGVSVTSLSSLRKSKRSGKLLVETGLRRSRDKKFLRLLTYLRVIK
jgi:hypothetical protein